MAPHALKKRKVSPDSNGKVTREDQLPELDSDAESVGDDQDASSEDDNDDDDDADRIVMRDPKQPRQSPKTKNKRRTNHERHQRGLLNPLDSSLFNLQVDELLAEVQPDFDGRISSVNATLRKVKTLLESIPPREECSILEAERGIRASHGITVPFPDPRPAKDVKWKLSYSRPADINVVGSYALRTLTQVGPTMAVDLAVTMPSTLFQEKDYLNYRYFHKRAYYLACLAAGIRDSKDCRFEVHFQYLNGNALQPILVLKSAKDGEDPDFSASSCDIHIIPIISEDVFSKVKTQPTANCVRHGKIEEKTQSKALPPTPFYNASLRVDCSVTSYLKFLHGTSSRCASYRDACVLGRVWLHQRGFGSAVPLGGFGNFEWAALIAILLQGGGPKGQSVLSPGYSSHQIFKATLQFLASRDLVEAPLSFRIEGVAVRKSALPQLVDGVRCVDPLFKMTPWSYKMLRHEAITSVTALGDPLFDHFDATYILKENDLLQKFDVIARVKVAAKPPAGSASPVLDHDTYSQSVCRRIYEALATGLGDRADLINLSTDGSKTWSLQNSPPSNSDQGEVLVGFVLNPANSGRSVDHGPSAEDKESAATFRKFWGAKAELRRFKDGSILESLVWSEAGSGEPIFQQIVAYLLDRHLGREVAEPTVFVATGFRRMLPTREMDGTLTLGPFKAAMTAFDELEKHIRSLEGLPLQLRQIFKADPQLRYASVRPPLKTGQRSTDPYGVVIQFEGSGRWPDDLVAIQRTKIAFLLKIGDLLEEAVDGTTARLGLENETHQYLNNAFLDIVQPSGAAFRLRIQNEREQTLLERQLKDKSVDPKSRDEAVTALAAYKRDFLQAPSHTQAMCTLCTRYPLLSPTVRLVKKWFEAHLLSGHIADEVVELLVVHTFVQPYPWRAPSSGVTGFLRTLSFLARWDWRAEPLIVDLSGDMSASDVDAMRTTFLAWRKIDPSMQRVALFAASNLDPDGVTWTQSAPSKVVAARMTALARSACVVVKDSGLSLDPQVLFTSSTADYDFALHITPKFLPAAIANGSASAYKNLRVQPAQNRELIGYDPVALFIAELKKIYPPSTVLFFHDPQGGETVNGVFAPPVSAARPFKVNLPYSTSPIPKPQDEGHEDNQGGEAAREEVRGNKLAMVHEMARLGGDMVRRVEWRF